MKYFEKQSGIKIPDLLKKMMGSSKSVDGTTGKTVGMFRKVLGGIKDKTKKLFSRNKKVDSTQPKLLGPGSTDIPASTGVSTQVISENTTPKKMSLLTKGLIGSGIALASGTGGYFIGKDSTTNKGKTR